MPLYTFINTDTGEETTESMTMAQYKTFLNVNPHMKRVLTAPGIADPVRLGITKPPESFRQMIDYTKKRNKA